MYLAELKLWNFRKYGSKTFELDSPHLFIPFNPGLNVLVGENDSGKSAVLDAIKLVLKTHAYEWIKVEKDDFFSGSSIIRIELIFKDIKPNEAKNFIEWLGWEGKGDDATPILRLILQINKRGDKILPSDIRAGMDEIGSILNAEAKEFLKVTYLRALRDSQNDLVAKKNSRLSQILIEHKLLRRITEDEKHELENEFDGVNKKLKEWFEKEDNREIKDKIDGFLKNFISNDTKSNLSIGDAEIKNILEKLSLGIDNSINIGLGSLNRLYMAAELLHLKKNEWDGLRLCLIEELEAHLHPQAQMQVIETFRKQENVQFILTSHSPNLASKVKLNELFICANGEFQGKFFPYVFPLDKKFTKLKESDYPFLERFIDVSKSNLFFAKGIIFVEGAAEELIMPALFKKLHEFGLIDQDLISSKISIIPINTTAFNRYSKIFKRIEPPYVCIKVAIVNDLDLRPGEYAKRFNIKQNKKRANKIITEFNVEEYKENKERVLDGQYVKAFISNYWTLEYCLALHPYLRKVLFKAIQYSIEENRADNYSGKKSKYLEIKKVKDEDIETKWTNFIDGKSSDIIAFDMMIFYIESGKNISKAIVANYFSELLENDTIIKSEDLIIADNPISYLIEAIKYVTSK